MLPPRPLPASNQGRGVLGDGAAAKTAIGNMLTHMAQNVAQAPSQGQDGLRDSSLAIDTSRGNPRAVKERQAALQPETHPNYKYGLPFPYLPFEHNIARRKNAARS